MRPLLICLTVVLLGSACTPSNDEMETSTTIANAPLLHMPIEGTWRIIRSPGHDRFAFDLAAVDPESRRTLRKSRFQHLIGRVEVGDSYSWSKPVFAPVEGTVVDASDGWPDRTALHMLKDVWAMIFSRPDQDPEDIRPFAGNYVIIQGDGFYVFLAHLQQGSLAVAEGDDVAIGQQVGRIGNSGFTLEPHLHLQLFDQIEDLLNAGAPEFVVAEFEQWTGRSWKALRNAHLEKGEVIRFTGYDR